MLWGQNLIISGIAFTTCFCYPSNLAFTFKHVFNSYWREGIQIKTMNGKYSRVNREEQRWTLDRDGYQGIVALTHVGPWLMGLNSSTNSLGNSLYWFRKKKKDILYAKDIINIQLSTYSMAAKWFARTLSYSDAKLVQKSKCEWVSGSSTNGLLLNSQKEKMTFIHTSLFSLCSVHVFI